MSGNIHKLFFCLQVRGGIRESDIRARHKLTMTDSYSVNITLPLDNEDENQGAVSYNAKVCSPPPKELESLNNAVLR